MGTELWDAAEGVDALRRPISASSLFTTYCAVKPVLAVAIGQLVGSRELSFEDVLGDVLDGCSKDIAPISIRQLMTHRSGIASPDQVTTAVLGERECRRLAINGEVVVPRLDRTETLYTEAAAWLVLGEVARQLIPEDLTRYVERCILADLTFGGEFDLRSGPPMGTAHRMNATTRAGAPLPLLIERTKTLAWPRNPGYGGRASIRGLVELNSCVSPSGSGVAAILEESIGAEMTSAEPIRFDRRLRRECSFSMGWLTRLDHHYFGKVLSPAAFGAVGLSGMTATWTDPLKAVSAGFHITGLADGETMVTWLRPVLVDAVMRDIARV